MSHLYLNHMSTFTPIWGTIFMMMWEFHSGPRKGPLFEVENDGGDDEVVKMARMKLRTNRGFQRVGEDGRKFFT